MPSAKQLWRNHDPDPDPLALVFYDDVQTEERVEIKV